MRLRPGVRFTPTRLLLTKAFVLVFLGFLPGTDCETEGGPIKGERSKACDILISVDQPLWEHYDENMTRILETSQAMLDVLNRVFTEQVFVDDFSSIYFRIARVQLAFNTCDRFMEKNCTEDRSLFLGHFNDVVDTSNFCLAYLLTSRDFHNGTTGLANIGTACFPVHNSGFVTFFNHGQERSVEKSSLTWLHEVGHSWGAKHDEEVAEGRQECINSSQYIMSSSLDQHASPEEVRFSSCSLESMKKTLGDLREAQKKMCLKDISSTAKEPEVEISICGNGKVEPGEECDCGFDSYFCNDPCCYPADISLEDIRLNMSAASCSRNLTPKCRYPSTLVFGIYVPMTVILVVIVLVSLILWNDWRKNKLLFTHVTQNEIRIVN